MSERSELPPVRVCKLPSPAFGQLAEDVQRCVGGLHWIKLYINDPFYRYIFREFQVY